MPTIFKAGGGVSKTKLRTANTQAANVKENTQFVDANGDVQAGTMKDWGSTGYSNLTAGQTLTIAEGYYNGNGRIQVNALTGDATVDNVLKDKKFYKDSHTQLTGTMPNNGAVSPADLAPGGSYTIPRGYHNGSGRVSAKSALTSTTSPAYGGTTAAHGSTLTISGLTAGKTYAFAVTHSYDSGYDSPAMLKVTGLTNTKPALNSEGRVNMSESGRNDDSALSRAYINSCVMIVGVTTGTSVVFNRAGRVTVYYSRLD